METTINIRTGDYRNRSFRTIDEAAEWLLGTGTEPEFFESDNDKVSDQIRDIMVRALAGLD